MKKLKRSLAVFIIGAAGYTLIEILWRGYSHISMAVAGGICFSLLYFVQRYLKIPFFLKCILGTLVISVIELAAGVILNIFLRLNVWDYSHEYMNILGQVCLKYSLLWLLLCISIFGMLGSIERFRRTLNEKKTDT
ncbi:MAG: hypothetical protein E7652_05320 [Ruminococcaceae bacterium]|nr:hypothetical protein [Oscillospiraceae bacterium]